MRLLLQATVLLASALLVPATATADGPSPAAEWIVLDEKGPAIEVRKVGDTPLGTIEGWACTATLITGVESGIRKDTFTVTCKRGSAEVRGQASHYADNPHRTESILLLSNSDTSMRIVAFGTRPKK